VYFYCVSSEKFAKLYFHVRIFLYSSEDMCTLTFIPKSNAGFIVTSNRDEAPGRATINPKIYTYAGIKLLFPKDELAGGTWIGLSDKNRFISLLNGGFTAHDRQDSYRISRGIIVTDLLIADNVLKTIESYNFSGVEPFTLVIIDWAKQLRIFELVWDGEAHHLSEKPLAPQIWSSSLLYSAQIKQKREQWFSKFLLEHINPSAEQLLKFHKTSGEGNPETDLIMDRVFVKTKSVTQIIMQDSITMYYEDLQNKNSRTTTF